MSRSDESTHQPSGPGAGLAYPGPLLITLLEPRHHRGVAVDVWVHGLRDLLFGPMSVSLTLASSLRLQDTVVVGVYRELSITASRALASLRSSA
jgi:hypothetical protein